MFCASSIIVLTACGATKQIEQDYNPTFAFKDVKHFCWFDNRDNAAVIDLQSQRIKQAIEAKMLSLDHPLDKPCQDIEADLRQQTLAISFHYSTDKQQNNDIFYSGINHSPWGFGLSGTIHQETLSSESKSDKVTIDFIEQISQKVIWRGEDENSLGKKLSPEERNERIVKSVDAIIEGFFELNKKP
jgi:hypothetical protein